MSLYTSELHDVVRELEFGQAIATYPNVAKLDTTWQTLTADGYFYIAERILYTQGRHLTANVLEYIASREMALTTETMHGTSAWLLIEQASEGDDLQLSIAWKVDTLGALGHSSHNDQSKLYIGGNRRVTYLPAETLS